MVDIVSSFIFEKLPKYCKWPCSGSFLVRCHTVNVLDLDCKYFGNSLKVFQFPLQKSLACISKVKNLYGIFYVIG